MDPRRRQPDVRQQADPMDAAFEQRAAAGERRIVAPVPGRLRLQRIQMNEPDVSDVAALDDRPEQRRERLVEVVLGDEDLPPGGGCGRNHLVEVGGMQKRRLLDDHVLASGKGTERPFEVCRRRERHEDHRDVAALHGRRVVGEVTGTGVPRRRRRAAAVVAARIEPPDVGRNGAQRLGVEIGRHAGSEERDPLVHSVAAM